MGLGEWMNHPRRSNFIPCVSHILLAFPCYSKYLTCALQILLFHILFKFRTFKSRILFTFQNMMIFRLAIYRIES